MQHPPYRYDPDLAACAIRSELGAQMKTQAEVCKALGLSRDLFNKFLRRKVNLLDEDINRVLKELDIEQLTPELSLPADFKQ